MARIEYVPLDGIQPHWVDHMNDLGARVGRIAVQRCVSAQRRVRCHIANHVAFGPRPSQFKRFHLEMQWLLEVKQGIPLGAGQLHNVDHLLRP